MDKTLSGTTTPGRSDPGSDVKKENYAFPQTPVFLEPHHLMA